MKYLKLIIKKLSRIKFLQWLHSTISYAINNIGLTRYAREGKRAIRENAELVRPFVKALRQRANISYSKVQVLTKGNSTAAYIDSYRKKAVKTVRIADVPLSDNEPISVCIVKDDLKRVKAQIAHHRQIGVRHFAYVDNESTDGTFEWLYGQEDISLFTVSEAYSAPGHRAWYRQAIDVLGYDRWYLILDSDEFFIYPGIENIPITGYIDFLEAKKIEAVLAPMIDMYSDGRMFASNPGLDFREELCWFDTDTYTNYPLFHMQSVLGGSRYRVSNGYVLSKYPLFKVRESYLVADHCHFPRKLNFQTKGAAAFLLHYKFIDEDYKLYLSYIESGVHTNKSLDYMTNRKTYEQVRDNPDISFYFEGSQKYKSSIDLLKINICDHKFFDEML